MSEARAPAESAAAMRQAAGWWRAEQTGRIEVRGGDRERWLDGMVSGDVRALGGRPAESRALGSGPPDACYALLLTPKGRIIADLWVVARPDAYWLELDGDALPTVMERLDHYVIADDVELRDASADRVRFSLEGPAAADTLTALAAAAAPEPGHAAGLRLAGAEVVALAFGSTGLPGFQLCADPADTAAVETALRGAESPGEPGGLVAPDAEAREIVRIESGVPRLGAELDESVLPAEAHLDHAVSATKGCFTGQEVVARMRSRGQVGHHLVGLVIEAAALPELGAELYAGDKKVGELTSLTRSPSLGPIALAFVRRPHHEPGTRLRWEGGEARVQALPFLPAATPPAPALPPAKNGSGGAPGAEAGAGD